MIRKESNINYRYETIIITKSRIEKGLLAIPKSLSRYFPNHNTNIKIYLDDSTDFTVKRFSSSESTTKENRIGGLADWFKNANVQDGDEVVVQIIDKPSHIYRLFIEKKFEQKIEQIQRTIHISENDFEIYSKLDEISKWTQTKKSEVYLNEYIRLLKEMPNIERARDLRLESKVKEATPNNIRILLEKLYKGHCQICNFSFLKINKKPYYEIHHINPLKGHHPQNLILVCANCHKQFEFAKVDNLFDQSGWLIGVKFNEVNHEINNIAIDKKIEFIKKVHTI